MVLEKWPLPTKRPHEVMSSGISLHLDVRFVLLARFVRAKVTRSQQ